MAFVPLLLLAFGDFLWAAPCAERSKRWAILTAEVGGGSAPLIGRGSSSSTSPTAKTATGGRFPSTGRRNAFPVTAGARSRMELARVTDQSWPPFGGVGQDGASDREVGRCAEAHRWSTSLKGRCARAHPRRPPFAKYLRRTKDLRRCKCVSYRRRLSLAERAMRAGLELSRRRSRPRRRH